MEDKKVTAWNVIKRFILGWLVAGVFLVLVSCVKYMEFFIGVFPGDMWARMNAMIAILVMLFGIYYILKLLSNNMLVWFDSMILLLVMFCSISYMLKSII